MEFCREPLLRALKQLEEGPGAPLSPAALPVGAQSPGQPCGLPEPQHPAAGVSGQSGQVPCAAGQVGRGWPPPSRPPRPAPAREALSSWSRFHSGDSLGSL